MQIIFTIIMMTLLIFNTVMIVLISRKRQTESLRRLRHTAISVILMMIADIAILNLPNRQVVFAFFTLLYISFAWLIYFFFRFSMAYTGHSRYPFYKAPAFWATIMATACFGSGAVSRDVFTISYIKWLDNYVWIARRYTTFYIYSVLCFAVVVASAVVLIRATKNSASLYRLKYICVFLVMSTETLFYILAELRSVPLFIVVTAIGIGTIVVMFMAAFYSERQLLQKALLFVADELNDGIVLYNEEHVLQFVTEGYCLAMGVQDESELADEKSYWEQLLSDTVVDVMWNGRIKEVVRGERKYYYDIRFNSFDEDGKAVGTVYWIKDITDIVNDYEKMIFRANYDELTGIYNEAHFQEECKAVLDANPETEFYMTTSSVENFKLFTDLFGKEYADRYFKRLASGIDEVFNNKPLCVFGRGHGDNFFVMMPRRIYSEELCFDIIDKVASEFYNPNYKLAIKLGVYHIDDRSISMDTICNRTSMAADAAKGDYNRRVVYFDKRVQQDSLLEEKLNAELTEAIERGDIKIYLHPQIDNAGNIMGAEALARWDHRELGLISPASFIPMLERNGRITELDKCIWNQACRKLEEWKNDGYGDLYISVNISAKDLYSLDIYEYFMGLVEEADISPSNLKLEITESAIINDLDRHSKLVDKLHRAGFEVEMDDFGSAYSSFNMLKDIFVDVLKIDMKFLDDTANVERSRKILKSIIDLSNELNMQTVAEGVETCEQYDFLKVAGCNVYQGFYFSKPMSVTDFERKYVYKSR